MLNYIWLALILAAVLIGGWTGRLNEVAAQSLDMANTAVVGIAFTLIGVMTLWLGVMRLAERAGLVALLARVMRPIMRILFPEVPVDHPAMGSMLSNIAANLLGLNNAATPFGLRAMKDLESLNPCPGVATNAMCTFLAINTSGVQLVPVTAIAILQANHASNPFCIVGPALICSFSGAVAGVLMAKFLSRLPWFRIIPISGGAAAGSVASPSAAAESKPVITEAATLQPMEWWGLGIFLIYLLFFAFVFARLVFPESFGLQASAATAGQNLFVRVVGAVSLMAVPFLLSAIPLFAMLRRVKVYEEFVEGAKEGFGVAIGIIPYLVAMLFAIAMFRGAGGIDWLSDRLQPLFKPIGFPSDLLPMVIIRPLSGSGSLGFLTELVKHFGPDSLISRMASTIYGSTETTFYVLAVYFGSVAIRRTRHALLAGLTADFVGVVTAVVVCKLMFT